MTSRAASASDPALDRLAFLASLRATRHFTDEPVSTAQLDRIIEVARWTGSARNRQPWRFVAVRDAGLRRELSTLGHYAQHLATAPLVLALLSDGGGWADTEFDVGRVSQTISLAAHALGLGSCLATFHPEANVVRAAVLLGVSAPWRVQHAISLGRPAVPLAQGRPAIPTGRLSSADLLDAERFRPGG